MPTCLLVTAMLAVVPSWSSQDPKPPAAAAVAAEPKADPRAALAVFVGDWDLAFDNWAADDIVRRSPGIAAGEALEGDSVAHPQVMGLVSISLAGTFGYDGWTSGSARSRADFYNALASGTPSVTTERGDVRQLVGRGGLTLAPGQHRTLYFAIVGGDTRAQFNANVAAATARANVLGFP